MSHVMEKMMYDEKGREICKPIEKDIIELKLGGKYKDIGDGFVEVIKRMGMECDASGMNPDSSRWYRFKPVKFGEL